MENENMFETCDAFNHYNPSVAAPSLHLLLLLLTFRSCASNDNDSQGLQWLLCVPHLQSSIGIPGVT